MNWRGPVGLMAATAIGAALALASAAEPPETGAGEAAALIDGAPVARSEYDRALAALAKDRRSPLTTADRKRILERLIEEELLVRRALEIGLASGDRAVRSALVAAMINQATAPTAALAPEDEALRAWYAQNIGFFRPQPSLRVATLSVARDDRTVAKTRSAIDQGETFETIASRDPNQPTIGAPNLLLPLSKVKDYLGGDAAERLAQTAQGRWAGPFLMGERAVFHLVRERVDGQPPQFEDARARIEAAYRRAKEEEAFRSYLEWLKSRAKIDRLAP